MQHLGVETAAHEKDQSLCQSRQLQQKMLAISACLASRHDSFCSLSLAVTLPLH